MNESALPTLQTFRHERMACLGNVALTLVVYLNVLLQVKVKLISPFSVSIFVAFTAFQPFGSTPASFAQQNDFGAFTSATSTATSINQTTTNLQNLNLGGTANSTAPAAGSSGDKYAAFSELANLDTGNSSGGGIDWTGGGLSSSTSVDWSGGNPAKGTSGVSGEINWGGAQNKPGVSSAGAGSTMFGSTSMPNMAAASSIGGTMGVGGVVTTQATMQGFGTQPGAGKNHRSVIDLSDYWLSADTESIKPLRGEVV